MIDTVKIGWSCDPRGVDLSHLMDTRQTQRDDGTATYSGRLGSLNVWVKEPPGGEHWWVTVSGSLARFHKGTNAVDFTWTEASDALGDVEEALGVGIGRASVTRLDLAANLRMDGHPANYLSTLTSISGGKYKASYYPGETVQFSNTLRTISLYDKGHEVRKKGGPMPPEIAGVHVLRCEVQFRRDLRRQMKQVVNVDALRSLQFAERATRLWEEHVGRVRIRDVVRFDHSRRHRPSDLDDLLIQKGLERVGGIENWRSTLASTPEESVSYQSRYRHLKRLRKSVYTGCNGSSSSMDDEFRRRMREASAYHLLHLPNN